MTGRAASALLALPLVGCSIARQPEEPPVRILALERELRVEVTSEPAGRQIHAARGDGSRGEPLGPTPVEIDRLAVSKQMWKHGRAAPPAEPSRPLLERRQDAAGTAWRSEGGALVWTLWAEPPGGGAPERVELRFDSARLADAYAAGRIHLHLPPAAGAAR